MPFDNLGLPEHWPIITSLHMRARPGAVMMDPYLEARREADRINHNRAAALYAGLERVLRDAPWVEREALLADLTTYHRDAMGRIPSPSKYPEAKPWVEHVLIVEREVKRLAALTDQEIALVKSLGPYLQFRGFKHAGLAPAPRTERCRTAFLLNTDRGPMHIKNVDDPWHPGMPSPLPPRAPLSDFWWEHVEWVGDGVGSGLHIDDEPNELFPLPAITMAGQHAHDTPGVVQFLQRYSPFWGGCNLLVYDKQFRQTAIEKCSRNYFEAFEPTPAGWSHVSGMACRDPQSPQGQYQRAKRDEYRALYNLPESGLDHTFWAFCDTGERKLADGLAALGPCPKADDVISLFHTPYPGGLCKNGYRCHPEQPVTEYTNILYCTLFDERQYLRWQRGPQETDWPDEPEICTFA